MTTLSALCVTKNRPEFYEWLGWTLKKQTMPADEVIVVDSSDEKNYDNYDHLPSHARVIEVEPELVTSDQREIALRSSTGRYITWYDDDDWLTPYKNEMLFDLLEQSPKALAHMVGGCWIRYFKSRRGRGSWWMSEHQRTEEEIPCVFPAMMFRGDRAREHSFVKAATEAEDTDWIQQYLGEGPWQDQVVAIRMPMSYMMIVHGQNSVQTLACVARWKKTSMMLPTTWESASYHECAMTHEMLGRLAERISK